MHKLIKTDLIDGRAEKRSEGGFSLLELVIAMVIFLIVTGAIYGLLQMGTFDRNRASRQSDVMKNARATIHLIGRDALNAGLGYHQSGGIVKDNSLDVLLGITPDTNTDRDSLTSVIAGNNITTNTLQSNPAIKMDIVTFAYRDYSFNMGNAVRINVPTVGSAATVARVTSKSGTIYRNSDMATPLPITASNAYDLYIIEGDTSQVAGMATAVINSTTIDFAPGDPLGINQAYNGSGNNRSLLKPCGATETEGCTTFNNATLKKFSWVSYRVNSEGTLIRTTYGNKYGKLATEQIDEQPLAYNIKNFQVKYVLRDGTVTDDPAAGPDGDRNTADDTPNNINLVAQITVSIEVQSTERDEQTKQYQVTKLTSTFGVRNLQYDAG